MTIRILSILFLALGLFACPAQAGTLDFYFTTTGQGGTIKGEIEGLQFSPTANTSSIPSKIIVSTQPSGYTYAGGDLLANGFTYYGGDDLFTVNPSGQISGGDVALYQTIGGNVNNYQGYGFDATAPGFTGANGVYQTVNGTVTSNINLGGFAGTTYTPVPEPRRIASLFLLAVGLLWLGRRLHFRFTLAWVKA